MDGRSRIAVISDIHGNLEALEAVLADLDARAPGAAIACAGDVVGYGPDPWACLDRLRARGAAIVMGNHEEMVLGLRDFSACVAAGIHAAVWTHRRLTPETRAALEALPRWVEASPGVVVSHGDLRSAGTYVSTPERAREALRQLEAERPGARVLVVGNTHSAMFYGKADGLDADESFRLMQPGETVTLRPDAPCLINPGAVGQARGGAPLAAYAVLDLGRDEVSYVAVPYDHETTLAKLRRAGLVARVVMEPPGGLGRRLERARTSLARRRAERAMRGSGARARATPPVTFERPALRGRAVQCVQRVVHRLGADAAYARVRPRQGALILTYHGISTSEDASWMDPRYTIPARVFEKQVELLARERRVLSLEALLDRLDRDETPEPRTVVVTFDDGYRSTLEVAAPILERHGLPAVLYLPTGYVDRAQSQPVDVLWGAFASRTRHALHVAVLGPDPVRLDRPQAVRRAYLALQSALVGMCRADREALLEQVAEQLRPGRTAPRLSLTWDEVRRLRERHRGFEIGVHTRDHLDLQACEPAVASLEVMGSVVDLRGVLGFEPRHLSFPYGRTNATARSAAMDAGLRSAALAGIPALVSRGVDRYALPRFDTPADMTLFSFYTSGMNPAFSLATARRAG